MSALPDDRTPLRTAALTVARSRRYSGASVITALWISAGIVMSLSSGFSAQSRHRSNESVLFLHPLHRRMLSVLHLDPVRRSAAAVRPVLVLRYQPLQAELAGLPEQVRADLALLVLADENPIRPRTRSPSR
jgi:hypothetical protein